MKNKFWAVILSAVVAFGMWLYVITIVSPGSEKTYYEIPVTLQNENILTDRGLMITSIDDAGVTLQLEGNRTDLNILNESNINILANMSGIMAPGTHLVSYDINFPGNIASNAITTQSKSPDMLRIKVENRITKNVEIQIEYLGSVPEGFLADKEDVLLDYPKIEVTGPESVVSQIDSARIQVDLRDQVESIAAEYIYTLCNAEGAAVDASLITTNVESVHLNVKVQRYKEVALKIKAEEGGGASLKNSSIKIEPKTIRVSGSDALLEGLTSLEIGTINLGEILTDETMTFPIVLPEGVTNITGTTEATVEIKFPNLQLKTLNVTQIEAINVPDGMEVDMLTQALEVKVRGPIALVERLKETDITVTVDFTGAEPGTATVNAAIVLASGYTDVGAVGTYNVTATVQAKTEGGS